MADISQDLQKILDAIYGEEVRGSIYHAISLINDVSEVILTTGTDITAPTDSSEGYFNGSLYLNLDTYELWKCIGTNAWQSLGILKGATGDNGNKWYRGLAVSGKAVLPTVYPTGIANANANDFYLNPSEGAIYHCVTGGDDTTATWSYDFTMTGGGGGGSIVAWTQIQGSTGGVKIAEIDIDGATQDVYAPEGGGGGMLPYLYIDSEAGATVTVNQPDGTTITPTAAGSGHWECELTGGYGTYVIHSVLSGQGDATQSLAVDTVKEYHVTDTHYDYTINVTAPSGSSIRITGGGETYTGTGTGSSQAFAVHTPSTTYTVAVTMDGNTKSETITSAATSGQSGSVAIAFGTINLTYANDFRGKTITCTKNGVTVTKTAPSSGNTMTFRVPTTGIWTISGTVSGTAYSVNVNVTSLSTAVSVDLQTTQDITVNLYSAANDTVTYADEVGTKTCVTDASGHGTATIQLRASSSSYNVTFTSSVAKDPDNLTNAYSKTVSVTPSTTEIYVMPVRGDKMLYWWGYKGNIEDITTANGWSGSNYTLGTGAEWDTNRYRAHYTSSKFNGAGQKTATSYVSGTTKINSILQAVNSSNLNAWFAASITKAISGSTYIAQGPQTITTNMAKYTATASRSDNGYLYVAVTNNQVNAYVYALWVE